MGDGDIVGYLIKQRNCDIGGYLTTQLSMPKDPKIIAILKK